MRKKILVIGSGFGGLSVAIRLAARGHDVEIFEKRDKPGGRAYTYEINDFKFDGGPSVLTAPFMFDEIWSAAGKRREDYFQLIPVNPFYRVFDSEKRSFDITNDLETALKEIKQRNPDDYDGYQKYLRLTQTIYQKGFLERSDKPVLRLTDLLKAAPELIRLQAYKSVYAIVAQFVKDDFLRRVLSFHTLMVGGSPFDTSSMNAWMPSIQQEWGVWYAAGGTGSIINAMVRLFEETGGRIHYNAEVSEITLKDRLVTGVRLIDGSLQHADAVVSNGDLAWTYRYLIPAAARRKYSNRRIDHLRYSQSLFVLYFGTKRRYNETALAHHNILLNPRYEAWVNNLFNKKVFGDEFSLMVDLPSLTDPSIAPPGCETFVVLSPVPNLDANVDWNKVARPYRDSILKYLEEQYLPDLRANIVAEHYIDPLHFHDTLTSYKGAAFSLQPVLRQSGWFRPHNQSEEFDNLYFTGAGTYPGASVPGVLASAKIVEDLIEASS